MGVYRTSGILPNLSLLGVIFLSIIAALGGILLGTHNEWWVQLLAIVMVASVVEVTGPGEMSQLAYIIPLVVFILGIIIGDFSWAIQTGVDVSIPEFTNPFVVN